MTGDYICYHHNESEMNKSSMLWKDPLIKVQISVQEIVVTTIFNYQAESHSFEPLECPKPRRDWFHKNADIPSALPDLAVLSRICRGFGRVH
jgi:hypothetical protein